MQEASIKGNHVMTIYSYIASYIATINLVLSKLTVHGTYIHLFKRFKGKPLSLLKKLETCHKSTDYIILTYHLSSIAMY